MSWTDDQWATFVTLLHRGWPGDLGVGDAKAYRLLLDDTEPADAVHALKRLLHSGARFRPSAAEILGTLNTDPGRPTFAEAYRLIFGSRGVLKARPDRARFRDEGDRRQAWNDAALERARTMHPLIASFVDRFGVQRLRELRLDDQDWGAKERRDLEREWNEHAQRSAERHTALAASSGRGQLAQIDPLTAIGVGVTRQIAAETRTDDDGKDS